MLARAVAVAFLPILAKVAVSGLDLQQVPCNCWQLSSGHEKNEVHRAAKRARAERWSVVLLHPPAFHREDLRLKLSAVADQHHRTTKQMNRPPTRPGIRSHTPAISTRSLLPSCLFCLRSYAAADHADGAAEEEDDDQGDHQVEDFGCCLVGN